MAKNGHTGNTQKRRGVRNEVPRKLTRFELLPIEILQEIFLLSMNKNLAKSSIHFARVLSNEHMYLSYFQNCFKSCSLKRRNPQGPLLEGYTPVQKANENANFCTDALDTRWMTPHRFVEFSYILLKNKKTTETAQDLPGSRTSLNLEGVRLPWKCFKPPYTDLMLTWTRQLIEDGAGVTYQAWETTYMGEEAEELWCEAIKRRDGELTLCLMDCQVSVRPSPQMLRRAMQESKTDLALIRMIMAEINWQSKLDWPFSDIRLALQLAKPLPSQYDWGEYEGMSQEHLLINVEDLHGTWCKTVHGNKKCYCARENYSTVHKNSLSDLLTRFLGRFYFY